jgi:hypothetical protein
MKQFIFISFIGFLTLSCCKRTVVLQISSNPIEILITDLDYKITEISGEPLSSVEIISLLNNYYRTSKFKRDIILKWGSKKSLYETTFLEELQKISNKFNINVVYLPIPIGDFDIELKIQYEKSKTK